MVFYTFREIAANWDLAAQQAQALHAAGVGRLGTDETTFTATFTQSSRAQIEAIKQAYEQQFGQSLQVNILHLCHYHKPC